MTAPESWREPLLRRESSLSGNSAPENPRVARFSTQQWFSPGFRRCHPGETPIPGVGDGGGGNALAVTG